VFIESPGNYVRLVKQRAGAFSEWLFVPGSKDARLIACNWNSGFTYLLKVGKEQSSAADRPGEGGGTGLARKPWSRGGRMKRIASLLSIAVILIYWLYSAGAVFLRAGEAGQPNSVSQLALFVCIKTVIVVGVIWPLLRVSGERFADLGFGLRLVGRSLLRGTLLAVVLFVLVNLVVGALLSAVGLGGGGTSPTVTALFRDPREAPLWVFCAVVGGGFNEELVRAFILTRFEHVFGRRGLIFAIVVDSITFGLGHLYQGVSGAVLTGFSGVLYALILLQRRRVADAMVAHAGFDLLGVAGAYTLYGQRA
jgi:membrane protease YdiL (CAAX protease family)